ncbi:hypothetical protein HAZT_HAZT003460 [Hyalella azteca]|uniref:Uncharacterized protein n=1 Tax=Hyalella azteca TaxID=294128 RepID=A0A6A0HC35_HYAAZ|nr:hypothetical protein HAZT_HAZT003460 [Hyalella azteca]
MIASFLRNSLRRRRDGALQQKPDQGKTMHLVFAERASSHFLKGRKYISFGDWRFIHRGRLDLLPVNGARRAPNGDTRCRRCVELFVVGSLGIYHPKNASLLKKIASRAYTKIFKQLCVAGTSDGRA